jgi:tetratricopeptide (TPR) repeat protein
MGAKAVRREAVALLEPYGPTQALALGYRSLGDANLYSEPGSSVELADKAITVCRQLGLDDELATAYSLRGRARFYLGDNRGGLGDLRRALDLCAERGLGYETVNAYSWLSVHTWLQDGPAKGLALDDEAVDVARKRGVRPETIAVGARPRILFDLGAWDDLLSETARRSRVIAPWQVAAAHALVHRGAAGEAEDLVTEALATYRSASGVARAGLLAPALVVAALVAAARGDHERAVALVDDAYAETEVAWFWRAWLAHDASRILVSAGELGLAERFVANTDPCDNRRRFCVLSGQAVLAEARGELREAARLYGDVAGRWADWGHPLEHGSAMLGAGRCLFALSEGEQAGRELREARSVFTRLAAEPLVAEVDSLPSAAASTPSSP